MMNTENGLILFRWKNPHQPIAFTVHMHVGDTNLFRTWEGFLRHIGCTVLVLRLNSNISKILGGMSSCGSCKLRELSINDLSFQNLKAHTLYIGNKIEFL